MFSAILDKLFGPIIQLPPVLAIAIFAFIVTLITTMIYKMVTDQKKLKQIKTKMKSYQKEMKKVSKEDPEQALSMQKKAMEMNMQYMQHSMKATLFTIVPVIIIFGWLNANMAYYPIMPGDEFTVYAEFDKQAEGIATLASAPSESIEFLSPRDVEIKEGKAEWELKGEEGKYVLTYSHEGQSYEQDLIISEERKYAPPQKSINKNDFISGNIVNEKVMPLQFLGIKWGWLGSYIIFSIIIGMSLRKMMGIS